MKKFLDIPQKVAVNIECKSHPTQNYLNNIIRFYKKYNLRCPHISNSMGSLKNLEFMFFRFSVFF